jgi:uncharacterized membrane protein
MSATIPGTGSPISFGLQTLAGTYWVLSVNTTTGCYNRMDDCVYITIDPQLPVSVTIAASSNPVGTGIPVTFTASPVNEGPNPVYQWRVNGVNAGLNQSTFTYLPLNGDEVSCMLTSNLPCVSNNPAPSNMVVMSVTGVPATASVTGIVAANQTRCYNATQTLTVAGSGTTFNVQSGGSATMIAGLKIRYLAGTKVVSGGYMRGYISTQFCGQQLPSIPSVVTGEESPAVTLQSTSFAIYPNPTSGNFTLAQTSGELYDKVQVEIYSMRGERLMTESLVGEKKHEFLVSDLPHGLYFVKVVAQGYVETFKLVKTR